MSVPAISRSAIWQRGDRELKSKVQKVHKLIRQSNWTAHHFPMKCSVQLHWMDWQNSFCTQTTTKALHEFVNCGSELWLSTQGRAIQEAWTTKLTSCWYKYFIVHLVIVYHLFLLVSWGCGAKHHKAEHYILSIRTAWSALLGNCVHNTYIPRVKLTNKKGANNEGEDAIQNQQVFVTHSFTHWSGALSTFHAVVYKQMSKTWNFYSIYLLHFCCTLDLGDEYWLACQPYF